MQDKMLDEKQEIRTKGCTVRRKVVGVSGDKMWLVCQGSVCQAGNASLPI